MKKLILVLIILLFPHIALATLWYVDNGASGTNVGTSWTDAWESFADISWGSIGAGDTLYISGGSTTKTYAEMLTVGASGTEGSPITITVGESSPHNGTVKITDGGYGIYLPSRSWVTIDGQSGGDETRHIEIGQASYGTDLTKAIYTTDTSNGVVIKYIYIHHIGANSTVTYAVEFNVPGIANQNGHEVAYCYFEYVSFCVRAFGVSTGQKSTGYGGFKIHHNYFNGFIGGVRGNGNVEVYDNTFDRMPYAGVGHPDGLQLYGSYIKIYRNTFINFLETTAGTAAAYWEPDGGGSMNFNNENPSHFQFYNNVMVDDGTSATSCIGLSIALSANGRSWTGINDILVANNTFFGEWYSVLGFSMNGGIFDTDDVDDIYIVNNIFYNSANPGNAVAYFTRADSSITFGSWGEDVDIVIDYNAYHNPGNDNIAYLSLWYSHAAFQAESGCQDNAVTSDPELDAEYKPASPGSPIVDAGIDLSAYFTTDIDGITRSGTWDIGAYEFEPIDLPKTSTGVSWQ